MSEGSRPRRASEASFRPMGEDGGLVVLPMKREIKVLNPVGILVFSLIDGTRTEAEIAGVVAEQFDVSAEDAARDVSDFLEELRENGMLAEDSPESVAGGTH